ncbi:protein disulfide oxidoreductase [Idiomarina xiamenensis]|uniref:Thioredoxin related protein n=1 Tax=Idiomarina xiamenensis 10-D-4 TaxID=740709 RepID=K2K5M0_9GAMM|nr:protein disulfide oxidoreductase [Idiomarina xiamenensis]EKE82898.1 thioredoxin related protein [Idiomarina xiamenensis 10-D-4]
MADTKTRNRRWRQLRNLAGYLLLMAVVVAAVDAWRNRQLVSEIPELDAVWRGVDGQTYNLRQLSADQPVLVYWWATWCPVCKVVSPSVNALPDEATIISVAISSGNDTELHRYQQRNGYHYPVINDQNGQLSATWGVSVTPTIMIIQHGEIVSATSGVTTSAGLRFRLWLQQIIND